MSAQQIPVLLTVKQFAEKRPAFTEGSLRWMIFKAASPEMVANDVHSIGK